jgi:hypothetical protein
MVRLAGLRLIREWGTGRVRPEAGATGPRASGRFLLLTHCLTWVVTASPCDRVAAMAVIGTGPSSSNARPRDATPRSATDLD